MVCRQWAVLSRHLQHAIPPLLKEGTQADWDAVEHKLSAGEDLESALDAVPDGSDLITLIVEESASLMLTAETNAVQSVVSSGKKFPLSDLIHHLIHPGGRAEIITTNYDRLIEVAVEMAGFQIDCAFPSAYYSQLDEEASIQPFRGWVPAGTKFRSHNRSHVRLSKPHGSLDWFLVPTGPVRSVLHIAAPRLMITPGTSKYLKGYDVPFDLHRERANEAIDRAARFLVIGYGFNDHHLETHLRGRLAAGVRPSLSPNSSPRAPAGAFLLTHRSSHLRKVSIQLALIC